MLYLSLYFKTHRQAYYDHLQSVRTTGDWEGWIRFFLTGVAEVATQATTTAQAILALFDKHRAVIAASGKSTSTLLAIHGYLQRHPVTNSTRIREACNISLPTVLRALAVLQSLGIIREITGKERHKVFVYQTYIDILNS